MDGSLGTTALLTELTLGHTFRCYQGHSWDRYPVGYEATVTSRQPRLRVAFDCPTCHTLLIEQVD